MTGAYRSCPGLELCHVVRYAGRSAWDHSAIIMLIEDLAGVTAWSALR